MSVFYYNFIFIQGNFLLFPLPTSREIEWFLYMYALIVLILWRVRNVVRMWTSVKCLAFMGLKLRIFWGFAHELFLFLTTIFINRIGLIVNSIHSDVFSFQLWINHGNKPWYPIKYSQYCTVHAHVLLLFRDKFTKNISTDYLFWLSIQVLPDWTTPNWDKHKSMNFRRSPHKLRLGWLPPWK